MEIKLNPSQIELAEQYIKTKETEIINQMLDFKEWEENVRKSVEDSKYYDLYPCYEAANINKLIDRCTNYFKELYKKICDISTSIEKFSNQEVNTEVKKIFKDEFKIDTNELADEKPFFKESKNNVKFQNELKLVPKKGEDETTKIIELEIKYKDLEKENEFHKKQIDYLEKIIKEKDEKIKKMNETLESKDSEIELLRKQLAESEKKNAELEAENDQLKQENQDINNDNSMLSGEIQNIKNANEKIAPTNTFYTDLEKLDTTSIDEESNDENNEENN